VDYSNPQIPEGINTGKEHPLKEFFLLTIGIFGTLAIALFILGALADKLAHYLPYSIEQDAELFITGTSDKDQPIVNYLQNLADKISAVQNLPEDMKIKIHYANDDVVNAYATLGGNVVLFRGLLEKIPNENALTMVMAHEIAHIKHRHPIRNFGSGVVIGLVATLISGSLGDNITGRAIGTTSAITSFSFSRSHETEADETAIKSVKSIYGHLAGASDLFAIFKELEGLDLTPEILSTHPETESRLQLIRQHSGMENNQITPLPNEFKNWLTGPS